MTTLNLEERINDFAVLGEWLEKKSTQDLLAANAYLANPWFTTENVGMAIQAIIPWLKQEKLQKWISPYHLDEFTPKTIGVVMAGNIPLAGFHDYLSVLITGNKLKAKLSSQDYVLLKSITDYLISINHYWSQQIELAEQIKGVDAVIATGSNNTSRYFEYYFRNVPLLLRRNRTSAAALSGHESDTELSGLAEDILSYFGLGCRNVSMIFLPEKTPLDVITRALFSRSNILEHHKYANSYTYQRALLLMDQQPFTDTGFCILRESQIPSSPVGVIHFQRYSEETQIQDWLEKNKDQIQCLVSRDFSGSVPFGKAQHPELTDYADNIDTIQFIGEVGSQRTNTFS